jgi:MFS family permease
VGGLLVQLSWHWVFLVNLPVGLVVGFLASRVLRESREPGPHALPDMIGAAMLTVGIASLTAAIVEGPDWGWASGRVIGLDVAALALLAAFVRRSATHPVPVIELSLLEVRSFAAANLASLLFFTAFGSMLLASVLFLTRVWGEDILTAGLQIAPGPLTAALFSVPSGLLSAKFGQRAVALPGAAIFGLGGIWWIAQVGAQPNYAADFLPGMIIGGAGVGLVIPSLASAAAASLPPARFATGSAVFGMSRQIGSALGIAILIAVLGDPAPDQAVAAFQRGWTVMLGASIAAAISAALIGRINLPAPAMPAPTEGLAESPA